MRKGEGVKSKNKNPQRGLGASKTEVRRDEERDKQGRCLNEF